jgi:hypothetical protein
MVVLLFVLHVNIVFIVYCVYKVFMWSKLLVISIIYKLQFVYNLKGERSKI